MFKLVVFSLVLAVVAAKSLDSDTAETVAANTASAPAAAAVFPLPHAIIQESSLAKVGDLIHHVPTAISHQSQTIVHDSKKVVTPVVTPVVKTRAAYPLVQTYSAPYYRSFGASYPLAYHYPFGYYYQYA